MGSSLHVNMMPLLSCRVLFLIQMHNNQNINLSMTPPLTRHSTAGPGRALDDPPPLTRHSTAGPQAAPPGRFSGRKIQENARNRRILPPKSAPKKKRVGFWVAAGATGRVKRVARSPSRPCSPKRRSERNVWDLKP